MQKGILLAKELASSPDKNHLEYIKDLSLFATFHGIFKLDINTVDANLLCSFLIYAYDPDSPKLDIRKDRLENKEEILSELKINTESEIIQDIIANTNESFNNCVLLYLEKMTNWRWITIYSLLDYHSNMIRFCNQKTESEKKFDKMNKEGVIKEIIQDYDIDTVSKVNIQKSDLLKRAIDARENADKLLNEIRKEFMPTDTVVQKDLGFVFTDTATKKVDVSKWRSYIKNKNS